MVSQLSLRLLNGSSGASAVNSSIDSTSYARSTNASTHGYSGDNEESKNEGKNFPSNIDMGDAHSKKRYSRTSEADPSGKKQKIMARNYAAFAVKQDLSGGDLPYPKICENPRLFASAGMVVDMSRVSLVSARDVEESPFLVPTTYTSPFESDYWNTLMASMVQSTCRVYKKTASSTKSITEGADGTEDNRNAQNISNDDAYSCASSISDSEEGDVNTTIPDAGGDGKATQIDKTSPELINMGSALSISNEARLVVLGFAPYSVVHVNAAYSRVTGIPSTTALGQPLHEILLDECIAASLQSNDASFSPTNLHLQAISMNSAKDMPKCVVRVSPVGSDADSVTHYVLELKVKDQDRVQTSTVHRTGGETIEVMG